MIIQRNAVNKVVLPSGEVFARHGFTALGESYLETGKNAVYGAFICVTRMLSGNEMERLIFIMNILTRGRAGKGPKYVDTLF